jgi:hypothetical protein
MLGGAAACGSSSSDVSSPAATANADDSGRDSATAACRTWSTGTRQSSVDAHSTLQVAARQARTAESRDRRWHRMAEEMSFVSSLPATGNTPDDQRKAVADEHDIAARCGGLGVHVLG